MPDPTQPNAATTPHEAESPVTTPLLDDAARAGSPVDAARTDAPSAPRGSGWKHVGRRLLYWTPVFVPMVLFAQVSFQGLRPALCEKERLAAAEVVLRERHARDVELAHEIQAHLRARQDPVFLERQRRLRELPTGTVVAADTQP
ncbi:MAG: hypothetical protein IPJ77_03410 [Planctomycetes bacterium]|nr:hypothetical protein [Planctomycetota bacterium]